MRLTKFASVFAVAMAAAAATAAPAESSRDKSLGFQKKAVAAYQQKDWAAFLENSRQAERFTPGNPRLVYNLACAEALTGDARGAAKHLESLLDRKLDLGLEADADFAGVRDSPAFASVLRKLAALKAPVSRGTLAFRLPEKDLVTEGIAHDPVSGAFFVSSVHRRKIVRRLPDGSVSDFVSEGAEGIGAVLALAVDPVRRVLWACTAAVPQMTGWEKNLDGTTGLSAWDLSTGRRTRNVALPRDGKPHVLNDLAISTNGDVYATDSAGSGVYRLRAGAEALETLVAPGVFRSPQGIGLSADGHHVWIAEYGEGIFRVDLESGARGPLSSPKDVPLSGVDGLVVHGRELLVTQNGIRPNRVARLTLDGSGRKVVRGEILEMNTPELEEPTLGVVVGDVFYCIANAQWGSFDREGRIFPMEKLHEPTILKFSLLKAKPTRK